MEELRTNSGRHQPPARHAISRLFPDATHACHPTCRPQPPSWHCCSGAVAAVAPSQPRAQTVSGEPKPSHPSPASSSRSRTQLTSQIHAPAHEGKQAPGIKIKHLAFSHSIGAAAPAPMRKVGARAACPTGCVVFLLSRAARAIGSTQAHLASSGWGALRPVGARQY